MDFRYDLGFAVPRHNVVCIFEFLLSFVLEILWDWFKWNSQFFESNRSPPFMKCSNHKISPTSGCGIGGLRHEWNWSACVTAILLLPVPTKQPCFNWVLIYLLPSITQILVFASASINSILDSSSERTHYVGRHCIFLSIINRRTKPNRSWLCPWPKTPCHCSMYFQSADGLYNFCKTVVSQLRSRNWRSTTGIYQFLVSNITK